MTRPHTTLSPHAIAAGVGLADRQAICGALAVLEATKVTAMVAALTERLKRRSGETADQIAHAAKGMMEGPASLELLRFLLWAELNQSLGLPTVPALSLRSLRQDSAAMGVRAVEILAPAHRAAHGEGWLRRQLHRLPFTGKATPITFPDLVAAEVQALLAGLDTGRLGGALDPQIAADLHKAQATMATAALAGSGWVVGASAIGSAGFAPYMAAASMSAFIPMVSGPALVSLLAVMINPVTVIAGTTALGVWAVRGQTSRAREAAAARLAVLMALRGLEDMETGLAILADSLRQGHRLSPSEVPSLSRREHSTMVGRARRIEARIGEAIPEAAGVAPAKWGQPLADRSDVALTAGLTAADMLYHAAAIDPEVLAAADFSRALSIETPLDLAVNLAEFGPFRARIGLRGYTAEQLVLLRLTEQGHCVTLAADSNTPGYDLLVDGLPVQVKCGTSLSLLSGHFERYPEIPVIADTALAAMAEGTPWAPLVSTVEGFDLDVVSQMVAGSLDAAAGLGDSALPASALLVGAVRGAGKAWRGEIPIDDLPAWLVIDLSLRGALAGLGQAGGAAMGLVLIGPAGALILGPALGVAALLGTKPLHDAADRALRNTWHRDVLNAAETLRAAIKIALDRRIEHLLIRQQKVRDAGSALPAEIRTWLDRRMMDDVLSAVEQTEGLTPVKTVRNALELLVLAARNGVSDPQVGAALARLREVLASKPSLMQASKTVFRKDG